MNSHFTPPEEKTNAFSLFKNALSLAASVDLQTRYRQIFFLLAAAMFTALPLLSFRYGVTYDEWMDANYGLLVLRFILSLGQNQEYMNFWHGYLYSSFYFSVLGFLYGFFFDTVPGFVYHNLHQDLHLIRFFTFNHFLTALTGCVAALYTGLLAKELGKWRAACLALVFMVLSPRFLGNAMNNPKDIPFMAAYVLSVYYTVRFMKELPQPKLSTLCALSAGLAMAIGVRPGGMILLPYVMLAAGYAWLYQWRVENNKMPVSRIAAYVLVVCVYGYMGGLLFWPYGISNPFVNPFLALAQISNFVFWNNPVLFEGKQVLAADLPWYYLPKWILISIPLFIIAGMILFLIMPKRIISRYDPQRLPFVLFTFIFPLFYIICKKSIVYDGWRHVFFVYPSLAVIAALSWDYLFEISKTGWRKALIAGLLGIHLLEPASWMIKNHPNETVYFNPLTGGLRGAFGKYETDYWCNAAKPAAEWLARYHKKNNAGKPARIRAEGHPMCTYPFLRKALGDQYIPFDFPPGYPASMPYLQTSYAPLYKTESVQKQEWDYAIEFPRWWPAELLQNGGWPPPGTIHEIQADGVTLAAVVKNQASQLQ